MVNIGLTALTPRYNAAPRMATRWHRLQPVGRAKLDDADMRTNFQINAFHQPQQVTNG